MTNKTRFLVFFTFATLLNFLILGTLGYQVSRYLTKMVDTTSSTLLVQSQKVPDANMKLYLAQMSNTLKRSDLANIEIYKSSNQLGNKKLAKKSLESIDNIVLLDTVGDNVFKTYEILYQQGYPQFANRYLTQGVVEADLTRDQNLLVATAQFELNNYQKAYEYLLKAKELDQYYPQTYEQLATVSKELGKSTEAENYEKFLRQITW